MRKNVHASWLIANGSINALIIINQFQLCGHTERISALPIALYGLYIFIPISSGKLDIFIVLHTARIWDKLEGI